MVMFLFDLQTVTFLVLNEARSIAEGAPWKLHLHHKVIREMSGGPIGLNHHLFLKDREISIKVSPHEFHLF